MAEVLPGLRSRSMRRGTFGGRVGPDEATCAVVGKTGEGGLAGDGFLLVDAGRHGTCQRFCWRVQ